MKRLTIIFFVSLFTLTLSAVSKDKPQNLIIFIGDGMGVAQVYAGMTASGYTMTFPSFPVTGFSITYSTNSYITDSAAGGTAIATGSKTNNRMIAMTPDSVAITTILEIAKAKGMSTGVVCTSSLTDATPASFSLHATSRFNYFKIAEGYLNGTVDFLCGGGKNDFTGRNDSVDVAAKMAAKGYDVVYTLKDLMKSSSDRIVGLLSDQDMPLISAGRDTDYLSSATSKAISVLSRNPKGFILLVEGSEIDDGGHSNSLSVTIDEVLDMDRAVKVAYNFAKEKNNTLIVVTADHETGGLTLTGGSVEGKTVTGAYSTIGHTAVMVPVFAYGPGSLLFTGVHQNKDLFNLFTDLLFLKKK